MSGSIPARLLPVALVVLSFSFGATDPDRDFSGKWILDVSASNTRAIGPAETALAVTQNDATVQCSSGSTRWSYPLDGSEIRKAFGQEIRNSATKWEGAALLINTLVSGPQNFTIMDRWQLSPDHNTLTISRQIVRMNSETEGRLVYRREGTNPPSSGWSKAEAARPKLAPQSATPPPKDLPPPTLAKRPDPGIPPDITVQSGTHVLLELVNELNTKHAKDGDRVYLRTAYPVAVDGRVVIPRGSDVAGTVTRAKKAGRVSGKGELFIRFDSIILPNGVSRDFHARPPGEEGKVEGDTKGADPRAVMTGAGVGATIGGITHGLGGAGIGGAAGALAGVLLSRNHDVVLRPGTHVEMVLDRDLVFHPDEVR